MKVDTSFKRKEQKTKEKCQKLRNKRERVFRKQWIRALKLT